MNATCRLWWSVLWLPLCLCLLAAVVTAIGTGPGEDLLIQRQYQQAAAALQQALATAEPGEHDRLLLLLGQAQLLGGEPAAAVTTLQRMQREQPGSGLLPAARFLQARAEEQAGRRREAAQIYRHEIERLCGYGRKEEIAAIWLGLSLKARQQDPPDWARAAMFCDLALDLGLEPARSRAIRLDAAEAVLNALQYPAAVQRLEPLAAELRPETGQLRALLALGRARRLLGDAPGARAALRDLLALQANAPEAADAAYEIALSFGVPRPALQSLERAVGALRELQRGYPAHRQAQLAAFLAAQCYQSLGRGDDALHELRQFLQIQADSSLDELPAARAMVGDVLAAQQKLEPAIAAWREYLALHPAHGEWERVQRAIVDAEWQLAVTDVAAGRDSFPRARERLLAFAKAYPLDGRNPDVLLLLADMLRQEQKFDAAREEYARCVSKYPGKDQSSRAQFAIGRILETETFHYEQALAAYRAVTWGPMVGEAQQRIATLTQKHLHVRTERIFRTDEAPAFLVRSRNIESLRVRVYKLQLEDWFRATHTAGQVERLDIEVIAADQTFDSRVPDYLKHRETERAVEVPFKEPGAYVVKVDDDELEATTMVLVSDLALIAKSSRHEFFVFTMNTKENRVAAGVRVVLSDGQKIVAEGVTGPDGVYRFTGAELQNRDDLRVFAVAAEGSGASTIDLSGLGYAPGLAPKGYLFADRPLYQPGQRVFWKGIVREVENGLYRLPAATGYRVQVFSPSGRVMLQSPVQFTAFGTFAGEVDLPPQAELGDGRLVLDCQGHDDRTSAVTFAVAKYDRPRLQLALELEHAVVFRGEPITGRAVARWFYGEPAAGRDVIVRLPLPDGAVVERRGTTNAVGELRLELPTGEFAEEAIAVVTAELPADGVQAQATVPVALTECEPSVRTAREVYLAAEPFEVTATLLDRTQQPLQREAVLTLLRLQRRPDGTVTETEVKKQTIATAKDGTARATFAAEQGGAYRVRLSCTDRFGNVTTGQTEVTVSGADDEVKLRLLCDRETFRVGETAVVKVSNRAGKKLTLFTWQGDGVLQHEARVLDVGEQVVQLPLRQEHAPNFALALAMVDGKRLHLAERAFTVERDLQLTLEVPKTARPGAEVEVLVRTRDPQGRGLAAEVAIAMVDQTLLAVRGDAAPKLAPFFWGRQRETGFRTQSSCTWAYDAPSRARSAALLAEEARRHLQQPQSDPVVGGDVTFDSNGFGTIAGLRGAEVQTIADRLRAHLEGQQQQAGNEPAGALARLVFPGASKSELYRSSLKEKDERHDHSGRLHDIGAGGWDFSGILSDLHIGAPLSLLFSNEPRVDFRETGAWLSSVVTDADGIAKVAIRLPDSTTGWRFIARGVTADTWVGEGLAELHAQKPLQVDYVGPPHLVEGDVTELGVRVHNLGTSARTGRLELQRTVGDDTVTDGKDVELGPHGEAEATFLFTAAAAATMQLGLRGTAGDANDAMRLPLPVQPFGAEVVAGRSGSTKDRAAFDLSLPAGREFTTLRMLVELGPDPGRDLLRAALGLGYVPRSCRQVEATNFARSSRGLAALFVLEYLERSSQGGKQDRDALQGLVQAMVQSLLQSQLADGNYAWKGQSQDLRSTCQVVRLLARCQRRGITTVQEPLHKAAEALLQTLRHAGNDARADLLWALADADRSRFEPLNALHRARHGLSVDALARLALAWQASKRPELAAEVLTGLRPTLPAAALSKLGTETIALLGRALLVADLRDALGIAVVAELRARRRGAGWETPEATAAALAVLTLVQGSTAGAPRATEITVDVNGHRLATTPATAEGLESALPVPTEWLRERGNEIAIATAGGGEAFYAVTLVGFERGFGKSDGERPLHVRRDYLAAPRWHDGRRLQAGFSSITGQNWSTFENAITQLGVGESGRVRVSFWMPREADRARATPLVLEEPLPAGCTVPRASIQGSFDDVDVQPDRLVLYFREGVTSGHIEYELQARFPGTYRSLPSRVYASTLPEFAGRGEPGRLVVHPRTVATRDPYRLTPDELLAIGTLEFDAAQALAGEAREQRLAVANEHLLRLLDEWQRQDHRLTDQAYREVARMLLFAAIERGDSKQVVRFFESIKDRHPDLVIPFAQITAVGNAYLDLGEFESALLVFRATAEAGFLKEAAVATTLEQQGEQLAATAFLERLLEQYPDLPTMRIARYSIGQRLAELAAQRPPTAPVDPRVGSAATLRQRALATFREFLVRCPEDPLAEEVSFAWATTHLEGKDTVPALAVAEAALQRYPGSHFEDELLYTVGYANWVMGKHDPAFAALERVATGQFRTASGGTGDSESKWHAVYLQGQIWHARGEAEQALTAYDRVQDRFTDAGEAIDYFRRRQLTVPEVTTFAGSVAAELELGWRNVDKVAVQVFQVDLMRLYLLERSLNDIRGIQLHGIKPLLAFEHVLGTGRDYKTQTKKLPLALPQPGAYLCVVRGGDRLATGLVLRSDLAIEAQEQFDTGRIRVNLKHGDACVAEAHVKVVGSGGGDFQSGETDLRGVFAADRLVGMATVVVKRGDQYAFYRGGQVHQPNQWRPVPQPAQIDVQLIEQGDLEKRKAARGFDALEQNFRYNDANRGRQVQWLQQEVLNKQQKGVEVYKTK